jgi:hypothetical protein
VAVRPQSDEREVSDGLAVEDPTTEFPPTGQIATLPAAVGVRDYEADAQLAVRWVDVDLVPRERDFVACSAVRVVADDRAVHGLPAFELPPDCAYVGWDGDVVEEPVEIHDGALVVPDGPGLGVTVDPDRLAEFAIETEGGSGFA